MDLQSCELTESTAQTVLQMMESNTTLVVLDLRHNPAIASDSLGKVRAALRRNDTGGVGGEVRTSYILVTWRPWNLIHRLASLKAISSRTFADVEE